MNDRNNSIVQLDLNEYRRLVAMDEIVNRRGGAAVWYTREKGYWLEYNVVYDEDKQDAFTNIVKRQVDLIEEKTTTINRLENKLIDLERKINAERIEQSRYIRKRFLFWTYYVKCS